MTVAANNKCDIALLASEYSQQYLWGTQSIPNTAAILESYINYICPQSTHINCFRSNCVPEQERVACDLQVGMAAVTTGDTIVFTITLVSRSRRL